MKSRTKTFAHYLLSLYQLKKHNIFGAWIEFFDYAMLDSLTNHRKKKKKEKREKKNQNIVPPPTNKQTNKKTNKQKTTKTP